MSFPVKRKWAASYDAGVCSVCGQQLAICPLVHALCGVRVLGEKSLADHVVPPLRHQLRGPALRGERALEDRVESVRSGVPSVAGEGGEIIGLREVTESDSPSHSSSFVNSSKSFVGVSTPSSNSVCARSAFPAFASASPSRTGHSLAPLCAAVVTHAASPVHDARNSVACCSQGPTERGPTKGGVSGRAEDLHPVSEVETGVNFRLACRVQGRLLCTPPGGDQDQAPGGAVTPSTRRFLMPNTCHLGADWASGNRWAGGRCVKPHSRGIWVLKGNARARLLADNLDHLSV